MICPRQAGSLVFMRNFLICYMFAIIHVLDFMKPTKHICVACGLQV